MPDINTPSPSAQNSSNNQVLSGTSGLPVQSSSVGASDQKGGVPVSSGAPPLRAQPPFVPNSSVTRPTSAAPSTSNLSLGSLPSREGAVKVSQMPSSPISSRSPQSPATQSNSAPANVAAPIAPAASPAATPAQLPGARPLPPVNSAVSTTAPVSTPAAPLKPVVPTVSVPAPAPVTPRLQPVPSNAPEVTRKFSTSVRTMKDDIELLKRGVLSPTTPTKPTPSQPVLPPVEVASSLPLRANPAPVTTPPFTPASVSSPQAPNGVLGELPGVAPIKIAEPAKTLPPPQTIETLVQPKPPEVIIPRAAPIMPTPIPPTIPNIPTVTPPSTVLAPPAGLTTTPAIPTPAAPKIPTAPTPSIPPSRGGADVGIKPLYVVIVLVLLLVLGIGIYFIASSGGNGTVATKTPVPTQPGVSTQPTIVPNSADLVFTPTVLQIKDTDTVANLRALLRAYNVPQGQVFSLAPTLVNQSSRLPLRDFLTKFSVALPPEMDSSFLNTRDYIYGVVSEQSADANTPSPVLRPFFVVKVQNLAQAQSALQVWEPTLLPSLSPVLDYSPTAGTFKQEFLNGIPFRYVQSPDAQHGIAYMIVDQYLLIASSRESFRAVSTRLFSLANQSQPGNTVPNEDLDALDEGTGY